MVVINLWCICMSLTSVNMLGFSQLCMEAKLAKSAGIIPAIDEDRLKSHLKSRF